MLQMVHVAALLNVPRATRRLPCVATFVAACCLLFSDGRTRRGAEGRADSARALASRDWADGGQENNRSARRCDNGKAPLFFLSVPRAVCRGTPSRTMYLQRHAQLLAGVAVETRSFLQSSSLWPLTHHVHVCPRFQLQYYVVSGMRSSVHTVCVALTNEINIPSSPPLRGFGSRPTVSLRAIFQVRPPPEDKHNTHGIERRLEVVPEVNPQLRLSAS